jgi:hypothetical protein
MASKNITPEPVAEPIPSIRSTLASIAIGDAWHDAAQRGGHNPAQLIHQITGHLLDAQAGLRQLASTAAPAEAAKIAELAGRLQ